MANVRSFNSLGVFAEDATTTIPAEPISGTAYRDTTTTPVQNKAGVKFDDVYESALNNQTSFIISSFTDEIANHGLTGWSNLQDYTLPAITYGSDSKLYLALLASGPAGVGAKDPISEATYWKELEGNALTLLADETSPNEGTGLVGHTNQTLKDFLGSPSTPKYVDTGAANAIILNPVQALVAVPTFLNDGREVIFKPVAINTLATTLEVGASGSKSTKIISQDGSFADPYAGYFQTTVYYKATFFVDDDVWIVERYFKSQDGSNVFASMDCDGDGSATLFKSKNVLSFVRLGGGSYSMTFNIDAPDVNYSATGYAQAPGGNQDHYISNTSTAGRKTVSTFSFLTVNSANNAVDSLNIDIIVFLNEA